MGVGTYKKVLLNPITLKKLCDYKKQILVFTQNYLIRILDEFDVFMDAVNRRISVQNIINYAREDRRNQFMFLTPLDTNNIEINSDVKIIKLQKLKS